MNATCGLLNVPLGTMFVEIPKEPCKSTHSCECEALPQQAQGTRSVLNKNRYKMQCEALGVQTLQCMVLVCFLRQLERLRCQWCLLTPRGFAHHQKRRRCAAQGGAALNAFQLMGRCWWQCCCKEVGGVFELWKGARSPPV